MARSSGLLVGKKPPCVLTLEIEVTRAPPVLLSTLFTWPFLKPDVCKLERLLALFCNLFDALLNPLKALNIEPNIMITHIRSVGPAQILERMARLTFSIELMKNSWPFHHNYPDGDIVYNHSKLFEANRFY